MTTSLPHLVRPEDEARHHPEDEQLWGESYYLDFVADEGALGGYVRVGWYPNLGVVWWTTAIVEPRGRTIMWVSFDAPATSTTTAQGPNYSVDLDVATPLEELRVRADGIGESFVDASAVYRGEKGEAIELGLDLSWHTDGQPFHYDSTTRYEIPCLVSGTLRLGQRTVTIQAQGQRDHSWGVRDWWAFGWCWMAARFNDGSRVHAVDVRIPGLDVAFGYVQDQSSSLVVVTSADITEDLGPEGLPARGHAILNNGLLELDIEPLAFGPLMFISPEGRIDRFPRALARFSDPSGRTGLGWVEWNQPEEA
jgi:hypothetical protein